MLTLKQYVEVNNLDTKRYFPNDNNELEEMNNEELEIRYHSQYINYVQACIYDKS